MADIKHVGKLKASGAKVVVAYRTIPGDSKSAVVIETAKIDPLDHDALMKVVESNEGQTAFELYEVLQRNLAPNSEVMLNKFHTGGFMKKVPTDAIEMTPNTTTSIQLDELNKIIAKQRGVGIDDLAVTPSNTAAPTQVAQSQMSSASKEQPLSDEKLAANLRSDADRLYKEAARLRAEAEELAPTTKKKSK
jgi:hypothetical protein